MAEWITVQGTQSDVGKSLIAEAITDILSEKGRVAPFKPVNFSRNSFPVDSSEIGYSTFHQARKSKISPEKIMGPVLVKPMEEKAEFIADKGVEEVKYSEIDEKLGESYSYIEECMDELDRRFDYVVWEGFGSMINANISNNPNQDLIEKVNPYIVLVGDISKGGVEASIKGVHELVDHEIELNIVNKASREAYRVDRTEEFISDSTETETVTVPYIQGLDFPREDGLPDFDGSGEIAVVNYPHISNTSDLQLLPDQKTCLVEDPEQLENAELIILPGSKNTVKDLRWMKEKEISEKIVEKASEKVVFGICGGFQMLGDRIKGNGIEEGEEKGLSLLDFDTVFEDEKNLEQVKYGFSGEKYTGYRIHYGNSDVPDQNLFSLEDGNEGVYQSGVGGTYIHDSLNNRKFLEFLLDEAGIEASGSACDASEIKNILRESLDSKLFNDL
ncbi:cobyric acid synthase [Candidatus Nanosalina sp. VS9-1]|uniref:cobyric acid synthase n=1 Tax=Candidatus Nanosalina sp. VS9-1 TaxID=3388566 RepID=UPI0039E1781F